MPSITPTPCRRSRDLCTHLGPCANEVNGAVPLLPARQGLPQVARKPALVRRLRLHWRLGRPLRFFRHRTVRFALLNAAVMALVLRLWWAAGLVAGLLFLTWPRSLHNGRRVPAARHPGHFLGRAPGGLRLLGRWRRSASSARLGGAHPSSYPYACGKHMAQACRLADAPLCHRYRRAAAHAAHAAEGAEGARSAPCADMRLCRLYVSSADGTVPPGRAPLRAARPRAARRYQRG